HSAGSRYRFHCRSREEKPDRHRFELAEETIMTSGRAQLLAAMVLAGVVQAGAAAAQSQQQAPIMLAREGAFEVGGQVITGDKGTLSCDHGYVEYQIPVDPRAVALFLWHSSSAKVWQNRWDGGEGFQSIFLRRGFPVYMWDGPRVGRGN